MSEPAPARRTNALSIIAMIFGGVALLGILPIVLGAAGIILGWFAMRKGEPLGKAGLIVAVVGTVLGSTLVLLLANNT